MNKLLIFLLLVPSLAAAYNPYNRPRPRPRPRPPALDSLRDAFNKVTAEPATPNTASPTVNAPKAAPIIRQLIRSLEIPVYHSARVTVFVYDKFDVYSGDHYVYGVRILWRL